MKAQLSPLFTWRGAVASKESDLTPTERHVALTLSLHMSEKGDSAFPSLRTLGEETGRSKNTVKSAIDGLEKKGWLVVERPPKQGRGKHNRYIAVVPVPSEKGVNDEPLFQERGQPLTKKGSATGTEDAIEDVEYLATPSEPRGKRTRDPIWDAVCDVSGLAPSSVPPSQRSDVGKTVKELKSVDATPEEIRLRAARWSKKFPHASFTHRCLRLHWAELAQGEGQWQGAETWAHFS